MCGWESQILGRDRWKSKAKTKKYHHFSREARGNCFKFALEIDSSLLHISDTNCPSFCLKCPRKCTKNQQILTFFQHFPKFAPLSLPDFRVDSKFDHIHLCVYYLYYIMQSLVFLIYFFQKLSKKNLWGVGSNPLVKEGLKAGERRQILFAQTLVPFRLLFKKQIDAFDSFGIE